MVHPKPFLAGPTQVLLSLLLFLGLPCSSSQWPRLGKPSSQSIFRFNCALHSIWFDRLFGFWLLPLPEQLLGSGEESFAKIGLVSLMASLISWRHHLLLPHRDWGGGAHSALSFSVFTLIFFQLHCCRWTVLRFLLGFQAGKRVFLNTLSIKRLEAVGAFNHLRA